MPAVLVVDDDEGIRDAVSAVLEDEGYEVSVAANGREALALIERGVRPRLMLLDLMMPVMNGWQLVEALRERGWIGDIPILIVTAGTEQGQVPGTVGLLHKPVALEALLDAVKRWVR